MVPDGLSGLAFAEVNHQFQLRETEMNRHPAPADGTTTGMADVTADDKQANHFLRLLSQLWLRTNFRIDMYQRGIAVADARGDVGYVCAFRHLTHIDKRDRQILEGLIDQLQR